MNNAGRKRVFVLMRAICMFLMVVNIFFKFFFALFFVTLLLCINDIVTLVI